MKRKTLSFVAFLIILLFFFNGIGFPKKYYYYNIKTVKEIKGEVVDFKIETPSHRRGRRFFFLYVKDKSGNLYKVELGPEWFIKKNFWKGLKITVKGSVVDEDNKKYYIIASKIISYGDELNLRDEYGFPLWRGIRGKGSRRRGAGERFN